MADIRDSLTEIAKKLDIPDEIPPVENAETVPAPLTSEIPPPEVPDTPPEEIVDESALKPVEEKKPLEEEPKLGKRDQRIKQLVDQKNKAKTETESLRTEMEELKTLMLKQKGQEGLPVAPAEDTPADITSDPVYTQLIEKGYEAEQAQDMAEMMAVQRQALEEQVAPLKQAQEAQAQQGHIKQLSEEMAQHGNTLTPEWDQAIHDAIAEDKTIQTLISLDVMSGLRAAYHKVSMAVDAMPVQETKPTPKPSNPGRPSETVQDSSDLGAGLDFKGDVRSQLEACNTVVSRRLGEK